MDVIIKKLYESFAVGGFAYTLVIFVVKVETSFYEKYTLYVSALNNGTHDLIRKERGVMVRKLFFVHEIQLIITVVLACLSSVFLPSLCYWAAFAAGLFLSCCCADEWRSSIAF